MKPCLHKIITLYNILFQVDSNKKVATERRKWCALVFDPCMPCRCYEILEDARVEPIATVTRTRRENEKVGMVRAHQKKR